MIHYTVTMKHSEKSFEALAHMQYDLFCKTNQISRMIISLGSILLGAANMDAWWGVLLLAYGGYMSTSKYASANRTAHKLCAGIKQSGMDFPASRLEFDNTGVSIIALPEQPDQNSRLAYGDVARLGEDDGYFYIFRDQYGGYMVPRDQLGDNAYDFRAFIEQKTGKRMQSRFAPVVKLIDRVMTRKRKK